jgi:hypothetical protein
METIDEWVSEHCEPFEGVKLGDEQQLAWSDMHREFIGMVELNLESFCKENGVEADVVFEKLADLNNNDNVAEDFVPAVIKMVEYDFFLMNMIETADIRTNRREARDLASGGDGCISGCYVLETSMTGKEVIVEYYKRTNCPWYFRKILTTAINKLTDVVVQHTVGDKMIFKYSLPVFGRVSREHIIDDERHDSTNMWGKSISVKCSQEKSGVKIIAYQPSYMPNGTNESTMTIEEIDGIEYMVWKRTVYDEDRSVYAELPLYFRKEDMGDRRGSQITGK